MNNRGWIIAAGFLILLTALVAAGVLVFQAGITQGVAEGAQDLDGLRLWTPGVPLLKIGLSVLLLLIGLRFAAHMIFFPLFGMRSQARHPRSAMHGPWAMPGPWGGDHYVPAYLKAWHDQAHAEDGPSEPSERQQDS